MTDIADQWTGVGLRFPLRPGPESKSLEYLGGMELIRQSIATILDTEPGERIMLPAFGCGLRRYLMEPNTLSTRTAMRSRTSSPRCSSLGAADPAGERCGDAGRGPFPGVDRDRLRAAGRPAAGQPGLPLLPEVAPMALISPILDDRTYEQLRDELVRRIPVYAPEWTDHNESDPGIALLELFAYLGESLLYRFNQIPDTTKHRVPAAAGRAARGPPQPGQVLLAVATRRGRGRPGPAGRRGAGRGGDLPDPGRGVRLAAGLWSAAGKTPQDPASTKAGQDSERRRPGPGQGREEERRSSTAPRLVSADPLAADAVPSTSAPRSTAPCGSPCCARRPPSSTHWPAGPSSSGSPSTRALPPRAAGGPARRRRPSVPLGRAHLQPAPDAVAALERHAPDDGRQGQPKTPAFHELKVLGDTTQGLVVTGVVKLELPATLPPINVPTLGGADSPPPLDDDKLAQNVIAWIQVCRPDNADANDHPPGPLGGRQRGGRNPVPHGRGRAAGHRHGRRRPAVSAEQPPRAAGQHGAGGGGARRLDDLGRGRQLRRQRPGRRATTWSTTTTARCPSDAGRVPQIGERIRVLSYRYGGGSAGNVAAGAVSLAARSRRRQGRQPAAGRPVVPTG